MELLELVLEMFGELIFDVLGALLAHLASGVFALGSNLLNGWRN